MVSSGITPEQRLTEFAPPTIPHRCHRGYDRHRHRHSPARNRLLPARRQKPHHVRADEGPRRPYRHPHRTAERHPGRPLQRPLLIIDAIAFNRTRCRRRNRLNASATSASKSSLSWSPSQSRARRAQLHRARLARLDRELTPTTAPRLPRRPTARPSPLLLRHCLRLDPTARRSSPRRVSRLSRANRGRIAQARKQLLHQQPSRWPPTPPCATSSLHKGKSSTPSTRTSPGSRPCGSGSRMRPAHGAVFEQFLRDHKDEIEVLQILYCKPYAVGSRSSSQDCERSSKGRSPSNYCNSAQGIRRRTQEWVSFPHPEWKAAWVIQHPSQASSPRTEAT